MPVLAVPPSFPSVDPVGGFPATSEAVGHPAACLRRKPEFKERLCDRCDHWYKPACGAQLYCVDCRTAARREQLRLWRQENAERIREQGRQYHKSRASACHEYRQAHLEERRAYSRNYMRRRYRADPAACKAYQKAWRLANPEKWWATQLRYRNTPCPQCGKVRQLSTNKKGRLVCRQCKADANWLVLYCYWCDGALGVKSSRVHGHAKHYHRTCLGALTRAALLLNVTRERVRQLVNCQIARLGNGYSRAQALEMIMKERLP
jgi:hypothetical protein